MTELTTDIHIGYWNALANQIITISSFLGGFSIAIIANPLVSKTETRLVKTIMIVSTLAGSFFLVTIFAMTKLLLMTTEGYPFKVMDSDLTLPRLVVSISFFPWYFIIDCNDLHGGMDQVQTDGENHNRTWYSYLNFNLLMIT